MKWLDEVQKERARELSEESGRNNCLPPQDIQLRKRPGETPPGGASGSAGEQEASLPAYIVRIHISHFGSGKAEDSCLIVYDSGAYHRVRQSQRFGSKEVHSLVLDGNFAQEKVRSLREILDANEIKNLVSEDPPRSVSVEATVTHLSIPRDRNTQQITVWKYFDTRGIGAARMKGVDDHGTKLVKPLTEWLKANLHEDKEVPSPERHNPKCLPER